MDEITSLGLEVFGNVEKFQYWFSCPIPVFNNLKPAELADSSTGRQMIVDELTRINHGIFA